MLLWLASTPIVSEQLVTFAERWRDRLPRIILVTSAFHMTRAESLFRAAGLDVTPFPVDFRGPTRITLRSFIPSGTALAQTDLALHEIYGRLYYWLRRLVVRPLS